MKRPGTWTLWSESDPRWNAEGRSEAVGDFEMPEEAKTKLEELKAKLGKPPSDHQWAYIKD